MWPRPQRAEMRFSFTESTSYYAESEIEHNAQRTVHVALVERKLDHASTARQKQNQFHPQALQVIKMCVRAHLFIRYVILIGRRETELSRTRRTMSYFFPVSDSSLAISSLHRQSAYLGPCACARKDCMRVRCLVCMPRGSERSSYTRLRRVGTGPTDDRIF